MTESEVSKSVHPTDGATVRELISARAIQERIAALGAQIREDVGPEEITLLCILKGSFIFTADLARAIPGPINVEFLGVQSYGNDTKSSGAVQITHDLTKPIAGRHVIIVEDIVDTGLTLEYLDRVLRARQPKSLRLCALLVKPAGKSPISPDYSCFEVGDDFVVGYGLDWAQRFRNLPYVGVVKTKGT
jgi:hypoxanthine phosphoribosyltransferase